MNKNILREEPYSYSTMECYAQQNRRRPRQTGLLIAPEFSFEKKEWRISGRSDAIIKNFLDHEPSDTIIELMEPVFAKDENGKTIRDEHGNKTNLDEKLVYRGPDNDIMIVELKSIGDKGFGYLGRVGREEHRLQLTLYMYLTGIRQGMLLYENKNIQEMKEIFVPYDVEVAKQIVSQIIYVNDFVDKEELPPREYNQCDCQCQWYNFKDEC